MDFTPFPKIPRLRRGITITEKLDGTNAQVVIVSGTEFYMNGSSLENVVANDAALDLFMLAGSRSRWITPGKDTDNFGFAGWVKDNAEELFKLGTGIHFGEWWGQGIQRTYMKNCKTFSLFNTARPAETLPECVSQVPVLYQGVDDGGAVESCLAELRRGGSVAAPSFMKPEGVVVYHSAARSRFKVLLEGDDIPKGNQS